MLLMLFYKFHLDFVAAIPLLEYFDRTYITGMRAAAAAAGPGINVNIGVLRPPTFPPNSWNVNHATLHDEDRTNNQTEGWNHR